MRGEVLDLVADVLDPATAVVAADVRDGTERTTVIAALGNLDVGRVARRRLDSRRIFIVECLILARDDDALSLQRGLDGLHDAAPGARPHNSIGLGNIVEQFLSVALAEATRNDQAAAAAALLILGHVEHRCDGLFLGRLDKGARVDDEDIRLCRLVRDLDAVLLQDAQHDFRIDEILGTAKTDKTCFHSSSQCL